MKKILVLALACWALAAHAQNRRTVVRHRPPFVYRQALHLSPLALIGLDYTALAGYEYRPSRKQGWLMEAGYIFGSGAVSVGENFPASGFLLRPSVRFFLGQSREGYVQVQGFFKQVTSRRTDWVGKDCVNEVPAYEQYESFRYRRQAAGLNVVFGTMEPISRSGGVYLDLYLGLGVRYKWQSVVGEPRSCYNYQRGHFAPRPTGFVPSLPGGLRVVVALR